MTDFVGDRSLDPDVAERAFLANLGRAQRRLRYRLRRQVYRETAESAAARNEAALAAGETDDDARREGEEQLREQFLRARADLENYRKRVAREREEQRKFANEGLVRDLLETVDNLERAIQGAEQAQDIQSLHSGVEMVHQQFVGALQRHGVDVIAPTPGDPFDPRVHEAVTVDQNTHFDDETVVACLQNGYRLHDRVLRAAMVKVAKR